MTPLATEVDNLRRWEAKARRDAEDIEKSFGELSKRAQRDQEEATRVRKEQDELLQPDAETLQQIIDLLAEAEKKRDLRLEAEERSTTLEQRAKLDAKMVARLCEEQDDLRRTAERLRLERCASCGERDQAIRERDEVQPRICSL